ncbi:MAG: hypothetical protein HPY53_15965 [Brevinematales bacterium]|nr:hypothetical protein [Brevinematales bacterium]
MFGCGKFDETTMLKYVFNLSGNNTLDKDTAALIDAHLMQCGECLSLVTELNRVEAATGAAQPVHIGLKNTTHSAEAGYTVQFSAAVPVRGAMTPDMITTYTIDSPASEIRIIPADGGVFRIQIELREAFGQYIELRAPGAAAPEFLKKPDGSSVEIRAVKPGRYALSLGKTVLHLEIRPDK